jgi:transcriptional regulator with XRE-family HTH domain
MDGANMQVFRLWVAFLRFCCSAWLCYNHRYSLARECICVQNHIGIYVESREELMTETTKTAQEEVALRNRIVGLLLRDARERAEKTKRECAIALGVSTGTITAYEEGRKPISLPELEILAYVTDTPASHFWEYAPGLTPEEEQVQLDEIMALRHRIVGALLRQARLDADLTQKDLAEVLGCPSSRISSYEFGERPIPLAELELLARHLSLPLEYFLDNQDGSVGEWHRQREMWQYFCELAQEIQEFVVQPINIKYLEIAMKLSQMPVGGLRGIAEGLLDITY